MDPLLLLGLLLVLGLGAWWWKGRGGTRRDAEDSGRRSSRVEALDTVAGWPPEPTRLLTQAERRAMAMLLQALPQHIVLAQVPLARFIRVPTRNSYHEWMRRVGQLCADLVVCDALSQVIAVVELRRPPGRDSERTTKRHERMDRVLRKAGIRVLVWNEEALPHPDAVREQVLPTPKAGLAGPPAAAPRPALAPQPAFPDTDPQADEIIEMREPPASTWFDELASAPVPLDPSRR